MKSAVSGFDFTAHARRLCDDLIARLPELQHIDMNRVAVSCCQTRKPVRHGLLASMTPLRFQQGSLFTVRRGRRYTIQRVLDPRTGRELLYILSFYLPRFMDYSLTEKLVTVLHELWHISPAFDGDLRRHPGRCYAHTSSQKQYDAEMKTLVDRWLLQAPDAKLYEFLQGSFADLHQRHGGVFGQKVPIPRLIPAPHAA